MTNLPDSRRRGRVAWLFAGAAAVAGLAAVAVLSNAWRPTNLGATPSAPVAVVDVCRPAQLEATVASWEGAAGHRIGTLTLANKSGSACVLPGGVRPSLIDRNGHDLIVGKGSTLQTLEIAALTSVQTLVQTGNYCGPTAQEPAAVALDFGTVFRLVATPALGDDSSGVPPCMGENGPTDDITIQPWITPQG
jgi:hypothetical protein